MTLRFSHWEGPACRNRFPWQPVLPVIKGQFDPRPGELGGLWEAGGGPSHPAPRSVRTQGVPRGDGAGVPAGGAALWALPGLPPAPRPDQPHSVTASTGQLLPGCPSAFPVGVAG